MEVSAQLVGSSRVVDIGYVQVGPSIIDMPKPGCWHLTLHGLGWTDSIDLVYNKDDPETVEPGDSVEFEPLSLGPTFGLRCSA